MEKTRFSPKVRQALERAGYELVQVPGVLTAPVTLRELFWNARGKFGVRVDTDWHGDFTRDDIEYFELPAGEIAWMPSDPLIPGSKDKIFPEQWKVVGKFSSAVTSEFGDGMKAVFPNTEHGVYLPFDHHRRTGEYILQACYTWTLNLFGPFRLIVGHFVKGGLGVLSWDFDVPDPDLGVLRLVVPA